VNRRIIWQYWETRGKKPAFIDGLHEIAKRNAGVEVVLTTPETLSRYLPRIPDRVLEIGTIAHKADMIRAMLVEAHGGMWLDSDAVVLQDLNWTFDLLEKYEFVGFGKLRPWWAGLRELPGVWQLERRWKWGHARLKRCSEWGISVNCFLSRPNGRIVSEWVRQQHAKLPRTVYEWMEIGSDLLGPICLANRRHVKVLPYERICPIPWNEVEKFTVPDLAGSEILEKSYIVMLSNASPGWVGTPIHALTVEDIAAENYLLSAIVRYAMNYDHRHPAESITRIRCVDENPQPHERQGN
jgi:hypothetical protein